MYNCKKLCIKESLNPYGGHSHVSQIMLHTESMASNMKDLPSSLDYSFTVSLRQNAIHPAAVSIKLIYKAANPNLL